MSVASNIKKFVGLASKETTKFAEHEGAKLDGIIAKISARGTAHLEAAEMGHLSGFYKGFIAAQKADGVPQNRIMSNMIQSLRPSFKNDAEFNEFTQLLQKSVEADRVAKAAPAAKKSGAALQEEQNAARKARDATVPRQDAAEHPQQQKQQQTNNGRRSSAPPPVDIAENSDNFVRNQHINNYKENTSVFLQSNETKIADLRNIISGGYEGAISDPKKLEAVSDFYQGFLKNQLPDGVPPKYIRHELETYMGPLLTPAQRTDFTRILNDVEGRNVKGIGDTLNTMVPMNSNGVRMHETTPPPASAEVGSDVRAADDLRNEIKAQAALVMRRRAQGMPITTSGEVDKLDALIADPAYAQLAVVETKSVKDTMNALKNGSAVTSEAWETASQHITRYHMPPPMAQNILGKAGSFFTTPVREINKIGEFNGFMPMGMKPGNLGMALIASTALVWGAGGPVYDIVNPQFGITPGYIPGTMKQGLSELEIPFIGSKDANKTDLPNGADYKIGLAKWNTEFRTGLIKLSQDYANASRDSGGQMDYSAFIKAHPEYKYAIPEDLTAGNFLRTNFENSAVNTDIEISNAKINRKTADTNNKNAQAANLAAQGALNGQNVLAEGLQSQAGIAPSETTSNGIGEQVSTSELFENLSEYGNINDKDLLTIQTAYSKAAGQDGRVDPQNPEEKKTFTAGLQTLSPEAKNKALDAFGMKP